MQEQETTTTPETGVVFSIGETHFTTDELLAAGIVIVVAFVAPWFIDQALQRLTHAGKRAVLSESGRYTLSRILRYVVWGVAGMLGLEFLGLDLSSFALLGGAIGFGIGFGLQNIFSNFISGVVLLLEKTLKVGDFVDLQSGVVGRVAEINVRYTRVTTNDSVDVIVPNAEFINGRVTNWTLNDRHRRIHVAFGVAYGSDKELVREAGLAAADTVEGTIREGSYQPEVWLVGFGDSSLDFELVVWVDHARAMAPARTNATYLWAISDELKKRDIQIPFPQRDLHLRSGVLKVERASSSDRSGVSNDERR